MGGHASRVRRGGGQCHPREWQGTGGPEGPPVCSTRKRFAEADLGAGRLQLVTQYDNATVGSGTVRDELKYDYDGWAVLGLSPSRLTGPAGNRETFVWIAEKDRADAGIDREVEVGRVDA